MKRLTQLLWMTVAIAAVLAISFAVSRQDRDSGDPLLRSFADNLDTFEDGSDCFLPDVTPWKWDSVFFVQPHTTQKEVEGIIGFASDVKLGDESTSGEGRMVFVQDGKVVQVMKFYSAEYTYIVEADSFFKTADPHDYLCFAADQGVTFTKNSRNIGGSLWAVLSLAEDVDDCVQSF